MTAGVFRHADAVWSARTSYSDHEGVKEGMVVRKAYLRRFCLGVPNGSLSEASLSNFSTPSESFVATGEVSTELAAESFAGVSLERRTVQSEFVQDGQSAIVCT